MVAMANAQQMTAGLITDRQEPPSPPQRDYPVTPTGRDLDQRRLSSGDSSSSSNSNSSHTNSGDSAISKVHSNDKVNGAQSYPSATLHSPANSIISQVKRQGSNSSLTSDCGIPFANENVGTIKQKPPHPPTPDYESPLQAKASTPSGNPLLTSAVSVGATTVSTSNISNAASPPHQPNPLSSTSSAVTFEMCSTLPRRAKPAPAPEMGGGAALIPSSSKKSFADSPLLRRSQSARSRELALPELTPPPPPAPHPPLPPLALIRGTPNSVGTVVTTNGLSGSSSNNGGMQACETGGDTPHKVAVIDDIEHMLASLTDQLDAMLDHTA